MKTKTKLTAILFVFATSLFSFNASNAQCYANSVGWLTPTNDELQSKQGILAILQGNNSNVTPGTPTLVGIGVNTKTPAYMLDILCDPSVPTNMDVNISNNGAITNVVAYRIGGYRVIWYNSDTSSIYGGENTPGGNYPVITGGENAIFGTGAGSHSASSMVNCTFIGYQAGMYCNQPKNTFIGCQAGLYQGFGTIPDLGANTYVGYQSGYLQGSSSVASGFKNTFMGVQSGYNNLASENVFLGDQSSYYNTTGYNNTVVGANTFLSNTTGFNNTVIGYQANVTGNPNNATAIGYNTTATASNTMILGDNSVGAYATWVGIGFNSSSAAPANSLEINARTSLGAIAPCSSGLRFTQLTTACSAPPNPGPGVLAVDNLGNVIYVQGGSSSVLGAQNATYINPSDQYVEWGTNPLLHNTNIPMGDPLNGALQYNVAFQDQPPVTQGVNDVGIGIPATFNPQGKLDVRSSTETNIISSVWDGSASYPNYVNGLYTNVITPLGIGAALNGGWAGLVSTGGDVGIISYCVNNPVANYGIQTYAGSLTSTYNIGVYSLVQAANSLQNYGGFFETAVGGASNWGTTCVAINTSNPSAYNYGVQGEAFGTTLTGYTGVSYGLWGAGQGSAFNYGVWGQVPSYSSTDWAGYFSGNVYTTGAYYPSDSTLKDSIKPIQNALGTLMRLKPRSYIYDTANHRELNLPLGQQYGLIAQDVKGVLPNLVHQIKSPLQFDSLRNITADSITFCGLNYTGFIPFLIGGIQQQQQTIDSLRGSLDSLTKSFDSLRSLFLSYVTCLNSLCGEGHAPINNHGGNSSDGNPASGQNNNVQDVTLSGLADTPLLYQNIPNPFSTGTKINYYLPQGTVGATMVFYDSYGNQIKQVQLSQTGNGTLNITPDNLTNGIYSYSLIVNGNVIDTKRMVLQK